MTDTSNAAWHPDPSGRYAQRYYDGTTWTEHVVDVAGVQSTDPVDAAPEPPTAAPTTAVPTAAPPADAPTGGYGQAGGYQPSGSYAPPGGYGQAGQHSQSDFGQPADYQAPSPPLTFASPGAGTWSGLAFGPGLVGVSVGLVLVVLSLFVLNWFSDGGLELTLGDIRDLLDFAGAGGTGVNAISESYINFGWLLGLASVGFALAATLVRRRELRLAAIAVMALMAVWHLATVIDLGGDDSPSLAIGAYLGVAGYVAGLIGTVLHRDNVETSPPPF